MAQLEPHAVRGKKIGIPRFLREMGLDAFKYQLANSLPSAEHPLHVVGELRLEFLRQI